MSLSSWLWGASQVDEAIGELTILRQSWCAVLIGLVCFRRQGNVGSSACGHGGYRTELGDSRPDSLEVRAAKRRDEGLEAAVES